MDYRYYRGDDLKIPHKILRRLHLLRQIGAAFSLCGIVLPFLVLIGVLKSTFAWSLLAFGLVVLGPLLYLVGMVWDTYIDRSS